MPVDSPLLYQTAWLQSELAETFARITPPKYSVDTDRFELRGCHSSL